MQNISSMERMSVRLPVGVVRLIQFEADAIGLTPTEYMRAMVRVAYDARGRLRVHARAPDQTSIAVVGTSGRCIGTLADLVARRTSIDGPEVSDPPTRQLPIMVHHSDCERRADGTFTGRLLATRRIRRPGRRASTKAERARAAVDAVADGIL